ncbi:MAG TPA: DUF3467 domain-containing protein [Candidatus Marinimicrobia bacterium]|nr:DUF3467 domain-containing protein [Candidatus Neomarinimicrobiota bacterium]
MTDKDKGNRLEININEQKAGGEYSNLAVVTHSPSEFVLDFCQVMPGMPKANVTARIILSPQHAKALLHTLQTNIQRYERQFGSIREVRSPNETQVVVNPPTTKLPN